MNKIQKINIIKGWLQRFGDSDGETFSIIVITATETWDILMQYDYDVDGDRLLPFNLCYKSFKHMWDIHLEDRIEIELDEIIEQLNGKIWKFIINIINVF